MIALKLQQFQYKQKKKFLWRFRHLVFPTLFGPSDGSVPQGEGELQDGGDKRLLLSTALMHMGAGCRVRVSSAFPTPFWPSPFYEVRQTDQRARLGLLTRRSAVLARLWGAGAVLKGECLPGARPERYFSINYPDFSPRFTPSWRSPPPPRSHCTAHLPYTARCTIKQ